MIENVNDALEFIKQYVDKNHKGNISSASRELGVKGDLLHKWLRGDRTPTFKILAPVLKGIGVDVLTTPTIKRMGEYSPTEQILKDSDLSSIFIHQVAGAGSAWELTESEPITTISIPTRYAVQAGFALLVDGDSMYPTIRHFAIVGINELSDFVQNEIYAIRTPYEGVAIKRISLNYEKKTYIIRSDNSDQIKYPPSEISIEENPHFLIGRVVWVWQNI